MSDLFGLEEPQTSAEESPQTPEVEPKKEAIKKAERPKANDNAKNKAKSAAKNKGNSEASSLTTEPKTEQKAYMVLARKYRPQNFQSLIGQGALVRTLQNAIEAERIHHAYVLTGIRGIGKTTTARILAMALNCEHGPATSWAEDDAQCAAIAQGRHVDVLEFDAASHTGVDDVRSLFEGVGYQPVQGRYKIYIIDEVHMLSRQAFNALLKTLEEPPAHVKFIFATTEVHKIPVTVLSRCQRFDLKRVTVADLSAHFTAICAQENIQIAAGAVELIAHSADGSVRDGLSLLDQAIALAGKAEITEEAVAQMLGQAGSGQILALLEQTLKGEAALALEAMQKFYHNGHDPLLVMQEVLKALHLLTRLKIVPNLEADASLREVERKTAVPMAKALPLDGLGRAYQMLLQGLEEAKKAPRPLEAVEMALVRVAYLAPIPALEILQGAPTQTLENAGQTLGTLQQQEAPKEQSIKEQKLEASTHTLQQAETENVGKNALETAKKEVAKKEAAPWEDTKDSVHPKGTPPPKL